MKKLLIHCSNFASDVIPANLEEKTSESLKLEERLIVVSEDDLGRWDIDIKADHRYVVLGELPIDSSEPSIGFECKSLIDRFEKSGQSLFNMRGIAVTKQTLIDHLKQILSSVDDNY